MNNPVEPVDFGALIEDLKRFDGKVIIQSMFLRGNFRGELVDNTTPEAVSAWLSLIREIHPSLVMIYPIARETPVHHLEKIGQKELDIIAKQVAAAGIGVQVVT